MGGQSGTYLRQLIGTVGPADVLVNCLRYVSLYPPIKIIYHMPFQIFTRREM